MRSCRPSSVCVYDMRIHGGESGITKSTIARQESALHPKAARFFCSWNCACEFAFSAWLSKSRKARTRQRGPRHAPFRQFCDSPKNRLRDGARRSLSGPCKCCRKAGTALAAWLLVSGTRARTDRSLIDLVAISDRRGDRRAAQKSVGTELTSVVADHYLLICWKYPHSSRHYLVLILYAH